jgi:hypothetical protein
MLRLVSSSFHGDRPTSDRNDPVDKAYHSPEAYQPDYTYHTSCDIWSLGYLFLDMMVWFEQERKGWKKSRKDRGNALKEGNYDFHYNHKLKNSVNSKPRGLKMVKKHGSKWDGILAPVTEMLCIDKTHRLQDRGQVVKSCQRWFGDLTD